MSKPTSPNLPQAPASPEDTYKLGGQEVVMTFGLLKELSALVGGPDLVPNMLVNLEVQEKVLSAALAERDADGNIVSEVNIQQMQVPFRQLTGFFQWVGAHIFDFFLQGLRSAHQLTEVYTPQAEALMPTLPGSPASQSKT